MRSLLGKVVVVTGAAMGIGRALASRAISEGARGVVVADISAELERTADELRRGADAAPDAARTRVLCVHTDVSRLADLEALLAATLDAFGAVNVLFNNAGVGGGDGAKSVVRADVGKWRWVMDVNFWSVMYGSKTFGEWMVARAMRDDTFEGHIINTASMAAYVSGFLGAYSASKTACVAVTERLLQDVYEAGVYPRVGVSCLCPAMVNTNILDQAKYVQNKGEKSVGAEAIKAFASLPGCLSPTAVADAVYEALRKGNVLYINTHAAITDFAIRARAESVCDAVVPVSQVRANAKVLRGPMSKL
jgi:NAD(P)-dependent dehydrogenase (short-subunit alcohol dehydrogenase family)